MNQAFQYQRLVLGYHGCDKSVTDRVLAGNETLRKSEKPYDWLGHGVYFWEHGPDRAFGWAEEQAARKKIETPDVLGAVIHLGNCLDMMDIRSTRILRHAFSRFKATYEEIGQEMPVNLASKKGEHDLILRYRDCAMIDWLTNEFDLETGFSSYDSVRGIFQEDEPAFEGSSIHMKSHIQIAIRSPACIIGYFRPI